MAAEPQQREQPGPTTGGTSPPVAEEAATTSMPQQHGVNKKGRVLTGSPQNDKENALGHAPAAKKFKRAPLADITRAYPSSGSQQQPPQDGGAAAGGLGAGARRGAAGSSGLRGMR